MVALWDYITNMIIYAWFDIHSLRVLNVYFDPGPIIFVPGWYIGNYYEWSWLWNVYMYNMLLLKLLSLTKVVFASQQKIANLAFQNRKWKNTWPPHVIIGLYNGLSQIWLVLEWTTLFLLLWWIAQCSVYVCMCVLLFAQLHKLFYWYWHWNGKSICIKLWQKVAIAACGDVDSRI